MNNKFIPHFLFLLFMPQAVADPIILKTVDGLFDPIDNSEECNAEVLSVRSEVFVSFNADGKVPVRITLEQRHPTQDFKELKFHVLRKAVKDYFTDNIIRIDPPSFLVNHTMSSSVLPRYHSFGENFGLINRIGYMRTLVEKSNEEDPTDENPIATVKAMTQLALDDTPRPAADRILNLTSKSLIIKDKVITIKAEKLFKDEDTRVPGNYKISGDNKNLTCIIEKI